MKGLFSIIVSSVRSLILFLIPCIYVFTTIEYEGNETYAFKFFVTAFFYFPFLLILMFPFKSRNKQTKSKGNQVIDIDANTPKGDIQVYQNVELEMDKEVRKYLEWVNKTSHAQGVLYDLDLLPEQLTTYPEKRHFVYLCIYMQSMEDIINDKDEEIRCLKEQS